MFLGLNKFSEGLSVNDYTSMDGTQLIRFIWNFFLLFSLFTIEFLNLTYKGITNLELLFSFCFLFILFPFYYTITGVRKNIFFLTLIVITSLIMKDPIICFIVISSLIVLYRLTKIILNGVTNAFLAMFSLGVSLVLFSSTCVVQFETIKESNIHGPWDAIWWSICTITTVGYGDKFPITDGGRVIALILMICGIGLFGTLIGYISSYFTDKEKKHNNSIDTIEELSGQIHELTKKIENIKTN